MLTIEMLKANTSLANLSEEQYAAITTLSRNDEDAVIGKRIGEIYREMDAKIKDGLGVDRNGDEKTYNYLERACKVVADKANKVDGLTSKITELSNEKRRLEKIVAEGGNDKEAQKQLKQAQTDLAAITQQYNDLKDANDKQKADFEKQLFSMKLDTEFEGAKAGLKFKADLPQTAIDVLTQQATSKIKGMNPEYIDNGNGGKVLVYKDEQGAILRNPEKQLNPYTTSELLAKELKTMGVLDERRTITGTGGKRLTTDNGGDHISVLGARTQNEAYEILANQFMSQGMINGSDQFETAMKQAWEENNVSQLPQR